MYLREANVKDIGEVISSWVTRNVLWSVDDICYVLDLRTRGGGGRGVKRG